MKRTGFTLVELLVVITIISVLVAMLLPVLEQAMDQSKLALCANQHRQMMAGVIAFSDDRAGKGPLRAKNSSSWGAEMLSDYYGAHLLLGLGEVWGGGYLGGQEGIADPTFDSPLGRFGADMGPAGSRCYFANRGSIMFPWFRPGSVNQTAGDYQGSIYSTIPYLAGNYALRLSNAEQGKRGYLIKGGRSQALIM